MKRYFPLPARRRRRRPSRPPTNSRGAA